MKWIALRETAINEEASKAGKQTWNDSFLDIQFPYPSDKRTDKKEKRTDKKEKRMDGQGWAGVHAHSIHWLGWLAGFVR